MRTFQRVVMGVFVGLWLWAIALPPAMAQSQNAYLGNQSIEIPASLVAPEPDMEIDIYPQPNTRKPPIGYGLNGDSVLVLEQTGSNTGTTWNRIQFEGTDDAEGWVQQEYLSIQPPPSPDQGYQSNAKPNRYMGNHSGQGDDCCCQRSSSSQSPCVQHGQQHGQQQQSQQYSQQHAQQQNYR